MVGKKGVREKSRAKRLSNSTNGKIKSPKKFGITSTSAARETQKKSRRAAESNIDMVPSSSVESDSDNDVVFLGDERVEIENESAKGKRKREKGGATKNEFDKQNRIKIKKAEARSDDVVLLYDEKMEIDHEGRRDCEKPKTAKNGAYKQNGIKRPKKKPERKKISEACSRQSDGKKAKKLKKVEEVEERSEEEEEEEETVGASKQRSESKKQDKKHKGKEVEAKLAEKSKKGNDVSKPQSEGKKDVKKKKVDGKKEGTRKRHNECEKEDKRDDKRQKMNVAEAEKRRNGAKQRDEGQKEDKKRETKVAEAGKQRKEANKLQDKGAKKGVKKEDKRQKLKVVEAEKQMNETNKQRIEGKQEREKKQENKKQKKKVAEMEEPRSEADQQGRQAKKEGKEDKKKKNKKVEKEMDEEEETEKSSNALYKFPMNRVSRIIKSGDVNNKIAQEAVFVINKASEKFLELFCREAYACAFLDHKNHIAYNHLSSVVSKRKRFDFLSDFVPEKVKAEAAVAEMSKAETQAETETSS